MKHNRILLLAYFLFSFRTAFSQVPSSCTIPTNLRLNYQRDWVNLAMTQMLAASSSDMQYVHVPAFWLDPIAEGMAAIFNATSIPERDSVFDIYCVHDQTSQTQTYPGYLIQVDTNYAWTQAWQNLVTLTGNAPMDDMLQRYGLTVTQFFNWSFGQYALLHTDSLWNNLALIDSLETVPGVIYGEPDALVGGAGKITYGITGNERYYNFYFEFNDCFDGCDNYRRWTFKVLSDCSVEYLGFQDWGVFGIQALPPPSNCQITTSISEPSNPSAIIFPNPATTAIRVEITANPDEVQEIIILDMTGREVSKNRMTTSSTEVAVDHLGSGMYFVVLGTQNGHIPAGKFVKQ